jgi:hypothetical protein
MAGQPNFWFRTCFQPVCNICGWTGEAALQDSAREQLSAHRTDHPGEPIWPDEPIRSQRTPVDPKPDSAVTGSKQKPATKAQVPAGRSLRERMSSG